MPGHVAIVTGSTGMGLGTDIAHAFAAEGAAVVVTGRTESRGLEVRDAIVDAGGEASFVAADLSIEEDCSRLVQETVERHGTLSVLVNNAVTSQRIDAPVADLSTEAWLQTVLVNLTAPFWLCRAALGPMLRGGGGSIVNIGSRVALRGSPNLAAYTASKGGLHALTRSITMDYGRQGIRCNTIAPGYIVGKQKQQELDDERLAWIADTHLSEPPSTAHIAALCVYLASDESRSVTGVEIPVDGGGSAVRGRTLG